MISSIEERINLWKPRSYFLMVMQVLNNEARLSLEGCSIGHELIGG